MNERQKLRHFRMLKGFSQNGIAKKLGITQQAYSKIESGQIKIDDVRMKEILKVLQCSPDNLKEIEKFFTPPAEKG